MQDGGRVESCEAVGGEERDVPVQSLDVLRIVFIDSELLGRIGVIDRHLAHSVISRNRVENLASNGLHSLSFHHLILVLLGELQP